MRKRRLSAALCAVLVLFASCVSSHTSAAFAGGRDGDERTAPRAVKRTPEAEAEAERKAAEAQEAKEAKEKKAAERKAAAERKKRIARLSRDYIPVTGCSVLQMGGDELTVTFSGRGMPSPVVRGNSTAIEFTFPLTRFDFAREEIPVSMTELIEGVDMEQREKDCVLTVRVNRELRMIERKGKGPTDRLAYQFRTADQDARLAAEPELTKPSVAPQAKKADTGPFSSKIFINLELRETALADLFTMLGTFMKKNVVVDKSIPNETVTMTLKKVPLSEVFEYLMKTYDIWYYMLSPNTVVVGTRDGLAKVSETRTTRAFRIAYSTPQTIKDAVTAITDFPAEKLVTDDRLGKLVVTAGPSRMQEIADIIQDLDHPGKQILMLAKIFEFSKSHGKDVDAAINMVYDHWYMNSNGGTLNTGLWKQKNRREDGKSYYGGGDGLLKPILTTPDTIMNGLWRQFNVAFQSMESKGSGKTLANPSVVALDGGEASIQLTEDYPYISDRDDNGNPTWSTKTVGPQLRLAPKIGRDGIITVSLNVQTGEVVEMMKGSNGETMPKTSNRIVETVVRVRNGEPFVIGGLVRESTTTKTSRVPVLWKLPLIGELFQSKGTSRSRTEAVVIIIPYVIDIPDTKVESKYVTSVR